MKPPAFQFYADDFLAGTIFMSNEERGLYITLLCRQWTQGHVTRDEVERLGSTVVQPSINHVLTKFQADEDGNLRNARLEIERGKQNAFRALQSAKGKASAQARLNRGSTVVQPEGEPEANSPPPSPSPSPSKNNTPISPQGGEALTLETTVSKPKQRSKPADEDIERIYQAYPSVRRGGRLEAAKAIAKAMAYVAENQTRFSVEKPPAVHLLEAVTAYANSRDVRQRIAAGEGQYLPMLTTWFNGGRFDAPVASGIPVASVIPEEPPGWQQIIDREFSKSTLAHQTTPWAKLTAADRKDILEAVKPYLT